MGRCARSHRRAPPPEPDIHQHRAAGSRRPRRGRELRRRRQILAELYGASADAIGARLDAQVEANRRSPDGRERWSHDDAWLIAYPDQFGPEGLRAVDEVVTALGPAINGVHLLPFHPSSSDGGFSVQDHAVVDPQVGSWDDVDRLGSRHRLMADAVVNHVSASSEWFLGHLGGTPALAEFFRSVPDGTDLRAVVRPRPGPPITTFPRADGSVADYWTTFGPDQVDLDYRSPEVLLAVFDVVFRYVAHGASAVRLDAVAFLWKDPATPSVHLPETHRIVALLRDCLDEIDSGVVIVTETNVAHDDNVAYLGTMADPEAHAVYQFTLAPLVLHAVQTGDVDPLRRWARSLEPRQGTTSMNFLASHDGVGVRPAKGWLTPDQVDGLADRCRAVGGIVNEAAVAGGREPYELAATWAALCGAGEGSPFTDDQLVRRHLVGHAVALALQGLPLLYVHSLVGSPNDTDRADASGVARDLNRGRFVSAAAFVDLATGPPAVPNRIWTGLREMLGLRRSHPAFHPEAAQRVWPTTGTTFVVEREAASGRRALVVVNLGAASARVEIGEGWASMDGDAASAWCEVDPWAARWLDRGADTALASDS